MQSVLVQSDKVPQKNQVTNFQTALLNLFLNDEEMVTPSHEFGQSHIN